MEPIPDEPNMLNYVTAARSNSIFNLLSHLRAQEINQGTGVPDSSTEEA